MRRSRAGASPDAARASAVDGHLPLILIEVVLVFGGVLAFGWWQLRDVKKAREQARQRREAEARAAADAPPPESPEPPR